jgi:hypothetical protein
MYMLIPSMQLRLCVLEISIFLGRRDFELERKGVSVGKEGNKCRKCR